MTEKLCVFCNNFDWQTLDYVYYSTRTGCDLTGGMTCLKNHFHENRPEDNDEFRKVILQANTCKDYEPANMSVAKLGAGKGK